MELDGVDNNIAIIHSAQNGVETMSQPKPVEKAELQGIREEKAEGTLNSAIQPMSSANAKEGLVYVDVTLPHADTNAEMTVTFDTAKLELTDVSGSTTAFAWNAEDGRIDLALAEADVISETTTVARLTFRAISDGETTVSIVTDGLGSEPCGHDERISVALPLAFTDVPEGSFCYDAVRWAVSSGVTTGATATTFAPNADINNILK